MVKLFQVIIPERNQNINDVENWLQKRRIYPTKMYSEGQFVLQWRTPDSKSISLLGELEEFIGDKYWEINIIALETSKPTLPVDITTQKFWGGRGERSTIENIIQNVQSAVTINFDYNALLLAASIIATAGLVTDNPVVVVASMLVSPLMGPIVGFCFGFVIRDWSLVGIGLRNEAIALLLTVFYGFLCGFVALPFGIHYEFPTDEMESRGLPEGLIVGIFIAAPSGVGVALSVTSRSVGALIGVAISASLLPPAVNSGLMICYGLFGPMIHGDSVDRADFCKMGAISFALVIVNIACIFLTASVTFWVKRIAPVSDSVDYYEEIERFQASKIQEQRVDMVDPRPLGEIHIGYDEDDIGAVHSSSEDISTASSYVSVNDSYSPNHNGVIIDRSEI
mmetsp:Transcript_15462/g.23178  ORF Transcript_15462/g.23178 Transcript_15462/m.23178 type:complete len:395 (+) Transcript_15462:41-1225(+)